MASVKVAVRVRPFNKRERLRDSTLCVEMSGTRTSLHKPARAGPLGGSAGAGTPNGAAAAADDGTHDFTYDYSYWSFDPAAPAFATQQQVYDDLGRDVIECAFQGYNACVFAYGQTGSGKTYTMMGSAEEPGLIPQTCRALFARQRTDAKAMSTGYRTTVSYLEIYNEKVKDLLGEAAERGQILKIREHRLQGPYVEGLSQHAVSDYAQIQRYIDQGNRLRTTASTNMNDTSSRSHAIFTITFTQAGFVGTMPSETVSKIHLVDLAGSERAVNTGATGQRLKEGAHINKSLVTLGSVISALAEQSTLSQQAAANNNATRSVYIPYRDSVLTWLLKDSLGGNSKTIMIAAISPAACNYTETLSTLRYANRAKNIINTPTINEDANVKLIRELRDEIDQLKGLLTGGDRRPAAGVGSRVLEDLKRKEAQEKELTDEWREKWSEVQAILREQKALGLRMSGAGVVLDSKRPHLIGIPDDKETGVTLYTLAAGETRCGTFEAAAQSPTAAAGVNRIVLAGENMLPEHCVIRLDADGRATIEPSPLALCWLNRVRIAEATPICQGDLLVLGGTNVFRYNNPAEAAALKVGGDPAMSTSAVRGSRMNLSRLSLASDTNMLSSIICNSEDELSFVCPLTEEATDPNSGHRTNHTSHHRRQRTASASGCDVDNLKQLNSAERDMLARKEAAFNDKRTLEAQIDEQSQLVLQIEAELEQLNQQHNEQSDASSASAARRLEDRLIQSEMQLSTCSDSLAAVHDEIQALELDHYALIVTRRRLENETLGKIGGAGPQRFHSQRQRAKSLMHLAMSASSSSPLASPTSGLAPSPLAAAPKVATDDDDRAQMNVPSRPPPPKRLDRSASVLAFPHTAPPMETRAPAIRITYGDSSQSMEQSSDGGISSQGCDGGLETSVTESRDSRPASAMDDQATNDVANATQPHSDDDSDDGSGDNGNVHERTAGTVSVAADNANDDDDDDDADQGVECGTALPLCCRMQALRHAIAFEKATLMKNLEVAGDKRVLDAGIDRLQELQRQYMAHERRMSHDGAAAAAERCVWHKDQQWLDNGGGGGGGGVDGDPLQADGGCGATAGGGVAGGDVMMRSLNASSVEMQRPAAASSDCTTRSNRSSSNDGEYAISIATYVLCGTGGTAHYEYEITISLDADRWQILRRYSRFREMHLHMKRQYGDAVAQIPFPRRQIFFPQTEAVAFRRRRQLEVYLRRLLVVCSKLPASPIYEDAALLMHQRPCAAGGAGLTRDRLVQFSPFFRKGVCECGHGDGAA